MFNLMFKTFMGPVEDEAAVVYLRPETAQGIYVNFLNVLQPSRQKMPFGIAQIGKAFRNEITPGNFIFRSREFEQMEMQFFVHPDRGPEVVRLLEGAALAMVSRTRHQPGQAPLARARPGRAGPLRQGRLRYRIRVLVRLEGDRGCPQPHRFRSLAPHQGLRQGSLSYFDEDRKEKFIPYIIETSAGGDRSTLVCLVDAYDEEEVKDETRVVLHFSPKIAPIKAAIFPLVKKDGMPEVADKIYHELKRISRSSTTMAARWAGATAAWTRPARRICITVDGQTLQDETVTVRDRDTMVQTRHKIAELVEMIGERLR